MHIVTVCVSVVWKGLQPRVSEGVTVMGGRQDKRRQPGKGREEQDSVERIGPDPVHPGSGERARGKSPEELKRRRGDDTAHERTGDEMRDEEL